MSQYNYENSLFSEGLAMDSVEERKAKFEARKKVEAYLEQKRLKDELADELEQDFDWKNLKY